MKGNLIGIVEKLSSKDQAIICGVVNKYSDVQGSAIHRGALPFLLVKTAVECLEHAAIMNAQARPYKRVVGKLKELADINKDGVSCFLMHLNDSKVAKRFGKDPIHGIYIKGATKRVTAGYKWSLPKRAYVPDEDVIVEHRVALKFVKKGLWKVYVDESHKERTTFWLMEWCQ